MARPAAREAPVFLVDPADQVALADRRARAVQEGLGAPADLVVREVPVDQAARAVLRPAAPARSPIPRPPPRRGSPRR
ncbi:hypothetical protein [Amycolatopsis sp. cmx-11-12]|uniref:hypothetical protein n=1 Tax=Amycolatopsis sp. cmx-11-12 TaxID=2785795 RepID=UPI0039173932